MLFHNGADSMTVVQAGFNLRLASTGLEDLEMYLLVRPRSQLVFQASIPA